MSGRSEPRQSRARAREGTILVSLILALGLVPASAEAGPGGIYFRATGSAVVTKVADVTLTDGSTALGDAHQRRIVRDASGFWYAVWMDLDDGDGSGSTGFYEVRMSKSLNTAGTTWSAPQDVAGDTGFLYTDATRGFYHPTLAIDRGRGELHIVFQRLTGPPPDLDTHDDDIVYSKCANLTSWNLAGSWYQLDGLTNGFDAPVNNSNAHDPHPGYAPSLALDSGGNAHIGYATGFQRWPWYIHGSVGTGWAAPVQMDTTNRNHRFPAVVVDSSDVVHYAWNEINTPATFYDNVYHRSAPAPYTAFAATVSRVFEASSHVDWLSMAADDEGNVHLAASKRTATELVGAYYNGAIWTQINPLSGPAWDRVQVGALLGVGATGDVILTASAGADPDDLSTFGWDGASWSVGPTGAVASTDTALSLEQQAPAGSSEFGFLYYHSPTYDFRRPVIIDRGQIAVSCGATLTDYPMLFNSTLSDLRHTSNGGAVTDLGGDDIIFQAFDAATCSPAAAPCTLDHEIEHYDNTTGELVAWVRLPSVNTSVAASDTVIFLTYGNSTVTSPTENPSGVWDSGFVGVWHLEENVTDDTSGGTHEDSTSNAHDGTQNDNGPTPAIAFGQDFDGTGDTITVPDDDTLSLGPNGPVTISAWVSTDTANRNMFVAKEDASGGEWEFYIRTTGNLTLTLLDGDSTNWLGRDTDAPFPTGGWHHVVATHDGSGTTGGITLYLDGAVAPSSAYTGGTYVAMDNTTAPLGIGAYDGGGNSYDTDGRIDEVRFSTTPRTACWIGAEFNNQAWPDKAESATMGPNPNPNEGFYGIDPPVATSVELMSFTAAGRDGVVDLEWRTGSELNNLGFHLYRALEPDGLWTRITPSIIPGLGSSPEGATYSFRDVELQNGTTYYYKLEDIDSTSGSTFHGPVPATPTVSAPGGDDENEPEDGDDGESADPEAAAERTAYGSPHKPQLRVLSRNSRAMVVELTTPGFVATDTPAGVRVSVRGFDARRHPEHPALPLKRALLNGVVGRHARVVWAREKQVSSFPDLVPAAVGSPEVFVGSDGTVQPRRREMAFTAVDGVHPLSAARIAGDAFIRKKKKLALELSPLRYDAASRTLRLAKKLQVKIAFDRQAQAGEDGSGSEGVRPPASTNRQGGRVLAYLHTLEKGLHAVPYEALGLGGPVSQKALRLSLQGQAVPHRVTPAAKKRFGPGSVLYFYAAHEASSLDHSSETTYALEQGPGGIPMKALSGSLKGLKPVSQAPSSEARFETNRFYQAGLLDAPDIWLWDFVVGGMSKSFPFVLPGLDLSATSSVQLQVVLQGASEAEIDGEHHLSVSVNGVPLGETTFDGKLPHVFTTTVPVSALLEGENTLEVTNLGDTGAYSFVFLDRFSVVHPRTRTLEKGRFEGVFSQKGRASLPGTARYGMDVTDPSSPKWVKLHKTRARRTFKALAGHRYVVASKGGLLSPRVSRPLETGLWEDWNQADYVLIAPAEFLDAAEPLLERRESQGLKTRAVSFEEIVSQFGHGRPSAAAIRDFLAYAYHHWEAPRLRYVLLLGDASYDPRNFTGFSKGSPLPALWAKTSYLVTSSDPLIGAVNGEDGLADVAIGRLPALTVEEAEGLVRKVLDWEDGGLDLGGKAILVADNPDIAGDFEWDIADIRTSFLQGRDTETIHLRDHGGNTRTEVLSALDQGASLLSYVGHGGPAVWASENVLNSWDPPTLLDQPEQPLMLTFNCLNGYFVAPNYDSLAEAFMKAEGRGTIGAFSPSGLSLDGPAHRFHRAVMDEIVNGDHERLGDAILAAQGAYAETGIMPELLAIYHLFADPAMAIQ